MLYPLKVWVCVAVYLKSVVFEYSLLPPGAALTLPASPLIQVLKLVYKPAAIACADGYFCHTTVPFKSIAVTSVLPLKLTSVISVALPLKLIFIR